MKEIFNLRTSTDPEDQHLFTHNGTVYRVFNEFELDHKQYAVMGKPDEPCNDLYVFHIKQNEALDIEDEEEWDRIVEAIDDFYT